MLTLESFEEIVKLFKGFVPTMVQTMTFDNGTEFYCDTMLVRKLGVKVYFADAYSLGNEAVMKTPTGCYVSTFQR